MSQAPAAAPMNDAPPPVVAPVNDAPPPAAAPVSDAPPPPVVAPVNDAPPPAVAPVAQVERIAIIDVVRGVALLGILLMNIPFFALPERFSDPWRADTSNVDFWAHAVNTVLFEGKMRALFSAVFGAGIVLFTLGKERSGRPATWLFYRRMIWLTLFGLAHAHLLLWSGDVLYFYGLIGMLAFLLRRAPPRWLALAVPLVAVVGFAAHGFFYQHMRTKRLAWREAVTAQAEARALTPAHESALVEWREMEKKFLPYRAEIAKHTALMKGNYGQVASFVRREPGAAEAPAAG